VALGRRLVAEAGKEDGKIGDLVDSVALPEPREWFTAVFGPENAEPLWQHHALKLPTYRVDVSRAFRMIADQGMSDVRVYRLDSPDDPRAVELQRRCLRAMEKRVSLFTISFSRPDLTRGIDMYNWVLVEGEFRIIGMLFTLPSSAGR
jgi:hypothetical protein